MCCRFRIHLIPYNKINKSSKLYNLFIHSICFNFVCVPESNMPKSRRMFQILEAIDLFWINSQRSISHSTSS